MMSDEVTGRSPGTTPKERSPSKMARRRISSSSSSSGDDTIRKKWQNAFGKCRDKICWRLQKYTPKFYSSKSATKKCTSNHSNNQTLPAKPRERRGSRKYQAKLYNVGDLVKKIQFFNNDGSRVLPLSKYVGPYKVTEVLGHGRYRITDVPGFNKTRKPYTAVITADRIRPWIHVKEVRDSDETDS